MIMFSILQSAKKITHHWRNNFMGIHWLPQQNVNMTTSISDSAMMKTRKEYEDVLPDIMENLIHNSRLSHFPEGAQWIKKILDYNLYLTPRQYGMTTMVAYQMFEKPENITREYIKLSKVLGWCCDMLVGTMIIIDDMMDNAVTRRGVPCWYRRPEVGMSAANDAALLFCCIRETLERYTKTTQHLHDFIRIFHEALLYTCMGQNQEFMMFQNKNDNYKMFTLERYKTLVRFKSAPCAYITPLQLSLTLVKDVKKQFYPDFEEIYKNLAYLIQMQDDYTDCYWSEEKTAKSNTDIQEGKCTWLAVTALQLCNETQKKQFIKYYGSKDPEDVSKIKALYKELNLEKLLKQAEVETRKEILYNISSLPWEPARNFFTKTCSYIQRSL